MTPTDKTPRVSDETMRALAGEWDDTTRVGAMARDLADSRARVAELEQAAESAERSAREAIAEARRDVDSANLALADEAHAARIEGATWALEDACDEMDRQDMKSEVVAEATRIVTEREGGK